MSYHESDSDYTNYLEQHAEEQQANEEERRRYEEEHPLWDKCRNHPDRQSIGPHCYDTQFCEECRENNLRNGADDRMERGIAGMNDPHNWPAERPNQGGWLGHTFTIPKDNK